MLVEVLALGFGRTGCEGAKLVGLANGRWAQTGEDKGMMTRKTGAESSAFLGRHRPERDEPFGHWTWG